MTILRFPFSRATPHRSRPANCGAGEARARAGAGSPGPAFFSNTGGRPPSAGSAGGGVNPNHPPSPPARMTSAQLRQLNAARDMIRDAATMLTADQFCRLLIEIADGWPDDDWAPWAYLGIHLDRRAWEKINE